MSDKYKYIDKDSLYVYPDTDVLKNKAGITNYDELVLFESITVQKRLIELQKKPFVVKNSSDLLKIHKHLFQDVYDWAGEPRKVEISKSGRQFLFTNSFDTAFNFIDSLLDEYASIPKDDKKAISRKLAEILDNVNYGHFFREGNGRTQREFIRELAIQKGYSLDLNPMDDARVYERYMHGTTFGDIEEPASKIKSAFADFIFIVVKKTSKYQVDNRWNKAHGPNNKQCAQNNNYHAHQNL